MFTPGVDGPLVPGIFREVVLDQARALGWPTAERDMVADDLMTADEIFLTNAVRGIIPVSRMPWGVLEAPGPRTRVLAGAVASELQRRARSFDWGGGP